MLLVYCSLLLFVSCSYEEYTRQKQDRGRVEDSKQAKLNFLSTNTYKPDHAMQKSIAKSIAFDLIVDCDLPVSLVEKPGFRSFLNIVDPKFKHVGR